MADLPFDRNDMWGQGRHCISFEAHILRERERRMKKESKIVTACRRAGRRFEHMSIALHTFWKWIQTWFCVLCNIVSPFLSASLHGRHMVGKQHRELLR